MHAEFLVNKQSISWLAAMQQRYEVVDLSKTARIVIDFNMQEVDPAVFEKR